MLIFSIFLLLQPSYKITSSSSPILFSGQNSINSILRAQITSSSLNNSILRAKFTLSILLSGPKSQDHPLPIIFSGRSKAMTGNQCLTTTNQPPCLQTMVNPPSFPPRKYKKQFQEWLHYHHHHHPPHYHHGHHDHHDEIISIQLGQQVVSRQAQCDAMKVVKGENVTKLNVDQ